MNIITVKTSKEYQVLIGQGLLSQVGDWIKTIRQHCRIAIISDQNVWSFYGSTVSASLTQAGYESCSFVFTPGEESKNANTFLNILNFLATNRLTRSDLVIALGGGVVGDITGFAAACYLRGIPYIQIPTSLLAMVDSSVGGKTAIDLPAGKNLVGAFYQPSLVLCDTDSLDTLPTEYFRDGCAEVIKYGILYDPELFSHLSHFNVKFDRQRVISRCVSLKRDVVMEDEFDTGARQKLNLGHTIGHGVEACSNFSISHGQAVAIGTAIISRAATQYKLCSEAARDQILQVLHAFALPDQCAFTSEQLCQRALSDKKRFGNTVNLIIPSNIGDCKIHPIHVDQIEAFIEAGL